MSMESIVEVKKLNKSYQLSKKQSFHVLKDISFHLYPQETLGIVGESGCGKTTLGKIMAGILHADSGSILYKQNDITKQRTLDIQMVFQDPTSSMNPNQTIKNIIGEGLYIQNQYSKDEQVNIIDDMLLKVGLQKSVKERLPHEFSGGQLQRINIARSLVLKPNIMILDEPTSSLDVSIQSQMINLLKDIQKEESLTYVFISHNLSVIRYLSDRIIVMYLGYIVEIATNEQLFTNALHPYTKLLLEAALNLESKDSLDLESTVKKFNEKGCPFQNRCPHTFAACEHMPTLVEVEKEHKVACHYCNSEQ